MDTGTLISSNLSVPNHFLTIEGTYFHFDLTTGSQVPDMESPLQIWLRADLTGALGINDLNAYLMKLLGALNVVNFKYNPREDKKWIYRAYSKIRVPLHQVQ
jgi:hypothetical protein